MTKDPNKCCGGGSCDDQPEFLTFHQLSRSEQELRLQTVIQALNPNLSLEEVSELVRRLLDLLPSLKSCLQARTPVICITRILIPVLLDLLPVVFGPQAGPLQNNLLQCAIRHFDVLGFVSCVFASVPTGPKQPPVTPPSPTPPTPPAPTPPTPSSAYRPNTENRCN